MKLTIVERYNEMTGTFVTINASLIKGRSRFAHTVATKEMIRALGENCV